MPEHTDEHIKRELREIRRQLHRYPELSGSEAETARRLESFLRDCHPQLLLNGIGGHGVAAVFDSGQAGPSVLFRADMDALPIDESGDFPHVSTVRGVSHKCGHDGHMAILLGLAAILGKEKVRSGKAILLFQPAEETGEGARKVLSDEKFAALRPDYAFALHNLPGFPKEQIVCKAGPFTAAVKSLIIRLHGRTAHAGQPETGLNPAFAIESILGLCRKMTLLEEDHPDFAVITPVFVELGEKAYGVSAGYGEVHLTLRTWTVTDMERLCKKFTRRVEQIAESENIAFKTEWLQEFETCRNDPSSVELVRQAAADNGLSYIEKQTPFRWGEDFGFFTQRFQGAIFGLGAGKDVPPLHDQQYDFPDDIIMAGSHMFHSILEKVLQQNGVHKAK